MPVELNTTTNILQENYENELPPEIWAFWDDTNVFIVVIRVAAPFLFSSAD